MTGESDRKNAARPARGTAKPAAAGEPLNYAAPALDKGLDIIEALVDAEHGLTKAEIAQQLKRNIGEIFRMIVTLERRGWVFIDRADRYHLSLRMFELAHRHRREHSLSEAAAPAMQALTQRVMQSCHLAVVQNGRILVIAQADAPSYLNFHVRVGAVVGLFNTASGLVLLAFRGAEERQRLIADHSLLAGEQLTLRSEWEAMVEDVARNGYACSTSQQVRGVTNISYPVCDGRGQVAAALTIPYMEGLGASQGQSLDAARQCLAETAAEISLQLGYLPGAAGAGA